MKKYLVIDLENISEYRISEGKEDETPLKGNNEVALEIYDEETSTKAKVYKYLLKR